MIVRFWRSPPRMYICTFGQFGHHSNSNKTSFLLDEGPTALLYAHRPKIIRIRDAEMFRRRAPAAALRPSRRSALGSSGAGSGNRHTPTHGHAHAMSQQQRERKPRAAR
jgi:hypothetical protein